MPVRLSIAARLAKAIRVVLDMWQELSRRTGWVVTRVVEFVLAVSGLAYTVLGGENVNEQALFLALWSLLAIFYIAVGTWRVRRQRLQPQDAPPPAAPTWGRALLGRRFSFFFTVAASLTGLGAALDVIDANDTTETGDLVTGLGVIVVICAWLLLSLGYARFYRQWTQWSFPRTPYPQIVDFLYLSVTISVSFATSDVEVLSRQLRWHVMVHSVVAFFYNAIVLAVAVGIITGR
jgi:uncharacterized membrane protein